MGLVEKWDPVLGPWEAWNLWDPYNPRIDPQYLRISWTLGPPETSVPQEPSEITSTV